MMVHCKLALAELLLCNSTCTSIFLWGLLVSSIDTHYHCIGMLLFKLDNFIGQINEVLQLKKDVSGMMQYFQLLFDFNHTDNFIFIYY